MLNLRKHNWIEPPLQHVNVPFRKKQNKRCLKHSPIWHHTRHIERCLKHIKTQHVLYVLSALGSWLTVAFDILASVLIAGPKQSQISEYLVLKLNFKAALTKLSVPIRPSGWSCFNQACETLNVQTCICSNFWFKHEYSDKWSSAVVFIACDLYYFMK